MHMDSSSFLKVTSFSRGLLYITSTCEEIVEAREGKSAKRLRVRALSFIVLNVRYFLSILHQSLLTMDT